MQEIYDGLFQLQERLQHMEKEQMVAAVCNLSGNVQFIVQLIHHKQGQYVAFFHKTIEEYKYRIKAEEYFAEIVETEEDMEEIEGLRRGIQIYFAPLEFIPESQQKILGKLGILKNEKPLYPLIFSLNDKKIMKKDLKGSEINFCKKVFSWLLHSDNLPLLESVTSLKKRNVLPKITSNQKTQDSFYHTGDCIDLGNDITYEEFIGYNGEKPTLTIPEFSLFRLKKEITTRIPIAFEIRLMFSPTHFCGDDEKYGPHYVLVIASDEEIMLIEPMDELNPQLIQETLVNFFLELELLPSVWRTKGIFAKFLKSCLDPLMKVVAIPVDITSEDSVIDTYTFDYMYGLMVDATTDLDEEEDRDFEEELENYQNALRVALAYLSKNPNASMKELENYLQKKYIRSDIITMVIQILVEIRS